MNSDPSTIGRHSIWPILITKLMPKVIFTSLIGWIIVHSTIWVCVGVCVCVYSDQLCVVTGLRIVEQVKYLHRIYQVSNYMTSASFIYHSCVLTLMRYTCFHACLHTIYMYIHLCLSPPPPFFSLSLSLPLSPLSLSAPFL